VHHHGYYGGIRLVKATVKRFVEHCRTFGYPLHDRNFTLRYESNIPRQVGLGGSSAIVVATLRCLVEFYGLNEEFRLEVRPSLALAVETEELNLPAGLQDRVIQVYEGLMYMDFTPEGMRQIEGYAVGRYTRLEPSRLPPLYLAYNPEGGKAAQVVHSTLRQRYEQKDPEVLAAMRTFASLTDLAREALERGDADRLGQLMDENFDTRRRITQIRSAYLDEAMFRDLVAALGALGCRVLKVVLPDREVAK
jgi:glucuronokinase